MPSSSPGPQRGVRTVNRALIAACALVVVAVAAVTISASQVLARFDSIAQPQLLPQLNMDCCSSRASKPIELQTVQ